MVVGGNSWFILQRKFDAINNDPINNLFDIN